MKAIIYAIYITQMKDVPHLKRKIEYMKLIPFWNIVLTSSFHMVQIHWHFINLKYDVKHFTFLQAV